ncbi:FHA domain-containing protein [Pseudactinotalea sp.]|uniref:FHA domain-containing protein n=1 Tax=Pseudactinotalea sp. TaxID=1926260 RepID=UPI003B3BE323
MTDYTYGPGEWTALAHGGRAAILDPAIDAESVAQIWESLSQGGSLESWLEVLAGHGLASLPSFGFVEPGDDGVRVVVRGEVTALVEDYEIAAGGMRTWREHVAPADTGVVLQVTAAEVSYPLIGGMVLASTLQVGDLPEPIVEEDAADEETAVAPEGADVDSGGAAVVAGAAGAGAGEVPDQDEPEHDEASEAVDESEPAESADPVEQTEEPQQADVAEQADQADVAEAAGDEPAEAGAEVEPDFVLDDDEGVADDEDVVVGGQPEGVDAAAAAPQPWAVPAPPAPQADQWGPPVQQAGDAAGFEQPEQPWQPQQAEPRPEQPWQAQAAAAQPWQPEQPWQPQQQAAQPADLGDHDGYTMRASDLPQPEGGQDPEAVADHTLAPAHEDEHSDQGGGAGGPALQLSLSTGQQVELDRPALIGRAPESSRFGFGETPRLVTVPSPQQDISRTHVEIKLEGDSVLVTDLRSTNGTVVVLPGSPPRRLHPGESVPVPDGTVIDLGDGVTAVVGVPGTAVPLAT